jgi:hypothetical protein
MVKLCKNRHSYIEASPFKTNALDPYSFERDFLIMHLQKYDFITNEEPFSIVCWGCQDWPISQ